MSKANPRKAVAALLPRPVVTPEGLTVRPMTLGMWAALESIGSPLVTGETPKDTLTLLPSLFLLCEGARNIFEPDLLARALAWADALPVGALDSVRRACERQMQTVFNVMPEAQPDAAQKKTTDGSSTSPTRPQRRTGGTTIKSSGASRSPRSASSSSGATGASATASCPSSQSRK